MNIALCVQDHFFANQNNEGYIARTYIFKERHNNIRYEIGW